MEYFQQGGRAHTETTDGHEEDSQIDILAVLVVGTCLLLQFVQVFAGHCYRRGQGIGKVFQAGGKQGS